MPYTGSGSASAASGLKQKELRDAKKCSRTVVA